jgi:Bacterial toxin 46
MVGRDLFTRKRSPFDWNWDPHHYTPGTDLGPHELRELQRAASRVGKLLRARTGSALDWAARDVLGPDAFAIGVCAGIGSQLAHDMAGAADLARVFVLAELSSRYFSNVGRLLPSLQFAAGSSVARAAIHAIDDHFGLRSTSEAALRQRNAIIAEVRSLVDDPATASTLFVEAKQAEFARGWARYVALRGSGRTRDQYTAGVMLGGIIAEILTLFAAGAQAVKLGSKVPQLLRYARAGTRRAAGGAGTVLREVGAVAEPHTLSAPTAPEPWTPPSPAGPVAEPAPVVEPRPRTKPTKPVDAKAPAKPVEPPLPLKGITQADRTLASAPTATNPEQALAQAGARKRVAAQFYEDYGGMTDETMASHLRAIDFSEPVSVGPPPPMDALQYQWRTPGERGRYYGDLGSEPTELGISSYGGLRTAEGRGMGQAVPKEYVELTVDNDAPYLQSKSAAIVDDWSINKYKVPTQGGATQRFVPNTEILQERKVGTYGGNLW